MLDREKLRAEFRAYLNEAATSKGKKLAKEGKIVYDGLNAKELESITNLIDKKEMRVEYWKKELKTDGHNRIAAYAPELNMYFKLMRNGELDNKPLVDIENELKSTRNKIQKNKISKISKINDNMKFTNYVDFYIIDNDEVPKYKSWLKGDIKIEQKDISNIFDIITGGKIEWEPRDIAFESDKNDDLYIQIQSTAYYNPESTSAYAEIPGDIINLILKKFKFKNYTLGYKGGE